MATNPNEVYQALRSKAKHPIKLRNLEALHDLCRTRHEAGSTLFTFAAIGRASEGVGILKASSLSLPQSEDYRALIKAWAEYTSSDKPKSVTRSHASDWIMQIEEPVVRALVEGLRIEVDKQRKHIAHLQAHQQPVVIYQNGDAHQGKINIVAPAQMLTNLEKEALADALDENTLFKRGIKKGPRGELTNAETGEVIFGRGFLTAIQKLTR